MTAGTRAAVRRADARDADGAASLPAARVSIPWRYLADPTFILAASLSVLAGLQIGYFFNTMIASLFVIATVGLLVPLRILSIRVDHGDAKVEKTTIVLRLALVSVWMTGAVALWSTERPVAAALAIMIIAVWTAQLIAFSRNGVRATLGAFLLCATPLLAFLVQLAWREYPLWLSICSTIFALIAIVSIGSAVRYAAQIFADLKSALREISGTKTRLEFAIESAGDGYFEIDLDTMTFTPNPGLAEAMGLEAGPHELAEMRSRLHEDDKVSVFQALNKVKAGEVSGWKQELRARGPEPDGAAPEWRWKLLRAKVIEEQGRTGRKLIGTLVDLTAWKNIEEQLRAAKEVAEASNGAKSQFLANMSHEIRTPLNGVLGMAQALEAQDLDEQSRDMVATIRDSGGTLMAILNDVLDLSKIEAGKLEITPVAGDLLHTVKRTRQLFEAKAREKHLELVVNEEECLVTHLTYDPVRVRQCLSNLLSNAIKFTSKGTVGVRISSKALDVGAHLVSIEVYDSGIGMSRETIDKLFTVFTQADGATTRKFGGTGLGLAISRQLARLMGGDIVVESTEGKGSIFRFTFKAQEAAPVMVRKQVENARPATLTLRGLRVLLTDDNAINRQVIKLFLAPQGCDIIEATNGVEALDKIAQHEFDIVLLDVHMPIMDGKDAIRRIRISEKWRDLPVIALTADAMSGDREKYLALGMTDYVSKPVDQRELIAKLHQVLGIQPADALPGIAAEG